MTMGGIPASTDLISTFMRAVESAGGTIECAPRDPEAIARAVSYRSKGAKRIAIAESRELPPELLNPCRAFPDALSSLAKSELALAEVGITEAFAGVARTGSVCVEIGEGSAGAVSLLARQHIVLLAAECVVERPADLLRPECLDGKGLTKDFVFVTGPSATADMGPLVRGVHGPHALHVILLTGQ
jgi:L-lactate dehydrogenase complex protein LldG